jgi:rhodanese-related sulfurtransferase
MPTAHRRQLLVTLSASLLGAAWPHTAWAQGGPAVSLEAARAAFEAGKVTLIDIREPDEHATGVAAGAQLLPMRQLAARLSEIPADPKRPVLLICNTQNRSRAVQKALQERGYRHVQYVNGGMSEWARRGWPMVKPGTLK